MKDTDRLLFALFERCTAARGKRATVYDDAFRVVLILVLLLVLISNRHDPWKVAIYFALGALADMILGATEELACAAQAQQETERAGAVAGRATDLDMALADACTVLTRAARLLPAADRDVQLQAVQDYLKLQVDQGHCRTVAEMRQLARRLAMNLVSAMIDERLGGPEHLRDPWASAVRRVIGMASGAAGALGLEANIIQVLTTRLGVLGWLATAIILLIGAALGGALAARCAK